MTEDNLYFDGDYDGDEDLPKKLGLDISNMLKVPLSGKKVYSINPAVKFYQRNGKYYWAVKSKGFDSLEAAVSDADGFVMTDLTESEVEHLVGMTRSEGYGKVGYFKSKTFKENTDE